MAARGIAGTAGRRDPVSMTSVPTWLAVASPSVALAALVVGVVSLVTARASLRVARETFRRAGPAVVGEGTFLPPVQKPLTIFVRLQNSGLAPVNVDRLRLICTSPELEDDGAARQLRTSLSAYNYDGPKFPHRLEAGSSARWRIPVENLAAQGGGRSSARDDWEFLARSAVEGLTTIEVVLGNGSEVEIPVKASLARLYLPPRNGQRPITEA
ncbi:hypothetical protein Nm8I071_49650 [Nonomuraea sp. TT08I-71]|nr:hypothetical protein Nm8I071_49650 [Nonomuraea sp. TT08I-71]